MIHFTDLAALRRDGAVGSDTEALDLFCRLSPPGRRHRELAEGELAGGGYRPQWCRLALDSSGAPLAAQAWWARSGSDTPRAIDLFGATDRDVATELLVRARAELGVGLAECWLVVPGDGSTSVEQAHPVEVAVLAAAGFDRMVDRVRVEWLPRGGVPAAPGRLTFRPAATFDEPELLELFTAVGDGSLDHHMRTDRAADGVEAEARSRLERTAGMDGPPHWFAIGMHDRTPVGYVRAAHVTGGRPVLAEIGVVRPMRGRRFVDDLLAHGTRLLAEDGAAQVRADTDLANTPMRAAFTRAGYREFARRHDYRWQRNPTPLH